jgi:very-short-patch-repair endonuclease
MGRRARVELAREFRKEPTAAEALLWKALRGRRLGGLKFRRQHVIGPCILDFFCPRAKLAVELDGEIHEFQKEYDAARTAFLVEQGLEVLRFPNRRVEQDMDQIVKEILDAAKRRI